MEIKSTDIEIWGNTKFELYTHHETLDGSLMDIVIKSRFSDFSENSGFYVMEDPADGYELSHACGVAHSFKGRRPDKYVVNAVMFCHLNTRLLFEDLEENIELLKILHGANLVTKINFQIFHYGSYIVDEAIGSVSALPADMIEILKEFAQESCPDMELPEILKNSRLTISCFYPFKRMKINRDPNMEGTLFGELVEGFKLIGDLAP